MNTKTLSIYDPAMCCSAGMLDTPLGSTPTPVTDAPNLFGLNIDPEETARTYRERVVGPDRGVLPDSAVASIEEQLSEACTVEVAAFNEFTGLMSHTETIETFDHIIFDTAPTGRALRRLQLPAGWTSFINTHERGASCLGPLSGLKNQHERYKQGVTNQRLLVPGVFRATDGSDALATHLEATSRTAKSETHIGTPRMHLQDPNETHVVLVTLAETTPVQGRLR